jgi:hypothetical protein
VKVGITGHQRRSGIKWRWVSVNLRTELGKVQGIQGAFSSLAEGSDQIFARVALEMGIPVSAVIPVANYEMYFDSKTLVEYRRLVKLCSRIQLKGDSDPATAFFEAGKFIVDSSNILFAIWDGEEAKGLGGTADIVNYANSNNRSIVHLNPLKQTVNLI